MSSTNKPLQETTNGKTPQYYNPNTDTYEVAQGSGGAAKMRIDDPLPAGTNNIGGVSILPMPDAQAIPTRGAGTVALAVNAVTVTATQVELKAGAAAMSGRKQLIVYPPAAGTIYWGPTGVTSATGAPLAAGSAPISFDMDPVNPLVIFAVNDATNRDIRVVESK